MAFRSIFVQTIFSPLVRLRARPLLAPRSAVSIRLVMAQPAKSVVIYNAEKIKWPTE